MVGLGGNLIMENTTRRTFLKTSAAVAATAAIAQNAHANVSSDAKLKVGLIGCGGRGTGAASQALRADRCVKLWAMADAFKDKIPASLGRLQREPEIAYKIDVPLNRQFVGF